MWYVWRSVQRLGTRIVCVWGGAACCHNLAFPLNVVWDLDETLISSEHVRQKREKRGEEQKVIILPAKRKADEVAHIDDDGIQFISRARPYAVFVLRALQFLPGCNQYVSTAASTGYMDNVLFMLDPQSKIFSAVVAGQSSRGKDLRLVLPEGSDPDLRRTVLVDNKASCHTPQPRNGIVVMDYVYPPRLLLVRDASGSEIGRFPVGGASLETPLTVAHSDCIEGRLMVAARGSATTRRLAEAARSAGAVALIISNAKRETSCFTMNRRHLPLPVLTVGAAGGRALQENQDAAVCTVPRQDYELVRVLGRLFLC